MIDTQLYMPSFETTCLWIGIAVIFVQDESFQLVHVSRPGLILGLHPANERRRYKVTPFVIGWLQS